MPTALLNAHAEELPRISARESLVAMERAAAGNVKLRRGERGRIVQGWQREAHQDRVVLRPKSAASYEAHMAMSGIAVRKTKRVDG